jgi:hypothetical protein
MFKSFTGKTGQRRAVHAEIIGGNTAIAAGITAHGTAPVLALCRLLIVAGHDPDQPIEVYRGSTVALRIRSIGDGARLTVDEHNGTRFAKWKPFCHSAGSPRIAPNLAAVS